MTTGNYIKKIMPNQLILWITLGSFVLSALTSLIKS